MIIFTGFLLLIISSTLLDQYLKKLGNSENDHYKVDPKRFSFKLVTTFSMKRNWYLLAKESKEEYRDLRFLNAGRTLAIFLVILGHCFWHFIMIPSNNPGFIENVRPLDQLN
jgi:hypothetical protein